MTGVPSQAVRLHLLCLVLCQTLQVFCTEFTNDRKRLGPLESVRAEHGCLEKFEASQNTIIRTEISRAIGAKFLVESDVGNREDCLSYCCQTHLCNVAVFEEKESGACYLFDCGPPEEFKCKFTSHTFYTSAVLGVNRHQEELEQSQHEAELANLRSSGEVGDGPSAPGTRRVAPLTTPPALAPKATSPTTTTTSTTTTPITSSTTAKPTFPPRRCKRYEFECHSGECIAIYNACDGIPQCQDSSDENPALSCPAASTEGATGGRRTGDGSGSVESAPAGGASAWENPSSGRDSNHDARSSGDVWQGGARFPTYGQGYDRGIFSHHSNILDNYGHYQSSGGPLEEGQGFGGRGRGPTYMDYNQRPAWSGPRYAGGESSGRGGEYLPPEAHRPLHYPDYGQPQQQQQQILPPMQQAQLNNNPVWRDSPNYPPPQSQQQLHQQMQDLQHPGMQQKQQQMQQQQQQQQLASQRPIGPYQQRPLLEHTQSMLGNMQANLQNSEVGMTGGKNGRVPTRSDQAAPASKTSPSTADPLLTPATGATGQNASGNSSSGGGEVAGPPARTAVHASHSSPDIVAHSSLARLEVNLEELEMEAREQDAQASGAVLALAMGVCITALLVVLVGCRLRSVRRRLRRNRNSRSPYSHDADYLVNGMYL